MDRHPPAIRDHIITLCLAREGSLTGSSLSTGPRDALTGLSVPKNGEMKDDIRNRKRRLAISS
jgi:hypothetical protein